MGESALFFGLIAYSSFSEACRIRENQLAFLYNLHYMSELFKLCSMHFLLFVELCLCVASQEICRL